MRSLVAYSLLIIQLALVRLVAAEMYAICSEFTKVWIANEGVEVGQDVHTVLGKDDKAPPTTLVRGV